MKKKVFEDLLFLKIKLNKIVQVYKILMWSSRNFWLLVQKIFFRKGRLDTSLDFWAIRQLVRQVLFKVFGTWYDIKFRFISDKSSVC